MEVETEAGPELAYDSGGDTPTMSPDTITAAATALAPAPAPAAEAKPAAPPRPPSGNPPLKLQEPTGTSTRDAASPMPAAVRAAAPAPGVTPTDEAVAVIGAKASQQGDAVAAALARREAKRAAKATQLSLALSDVGVAVSGAASTQSMQQALKAHYKGKNMTPRQVFDALDEDDSGFLDRAEVEKASGVLGAGLGFIMSAAELDRQFALIDPDGDGEVTFEEFKVWWKGVEAEPGGLISQALLEVGVAVTSGASMQSMKEALKAHYKGKDMTPREVFERLDEDDSGYLDRAEVEKASGWLGAGLGVIMSAAELDRQFSLMDPDGDGEVTFEEFDSWWKGVEAERRSVSPPPSTPGAPPRPPGRGEPEEQEEPVAAPGARQVSGLERTRTVAPRTELRDGLAI